MDGLLFFLTTDARSAADSVVSQVDFTIFSDIAVGIATKATPVMLTIMGLVFGFKMLRKFVSRVA